MKVLISGASIAGPALAYWLARDGHEVTVVERAPGIRPGGQAVDFRGEAHLAVLERMGILEEVRAHQTHGGAMDLIDAAGRTLVRMPASFAGGAVEIRRGDLAEILYRRTADRVEYVFDDSVASLTETGGAVHVTFERSAPRAFDLVVGADGLHSTTRRLAFGPEGEFVHDTGYHVAIFDTPNRLGLTGPARVYSEPGRAISAAPLDDAAKANVMAVWAGERPNVDRRDVEGQKRVLREVLAGMGWHTGDLLRDLDDTPYFYLDSISMVRMDGWSKGRVVLLGDAGYGATCGGMGTGLAIVCAYVLAGELALANGDHHAAFAAYEERIRKYTKACQQVAGGVGGFFAPKTHRALRLRTYIYKALTKGPMLRLLDKLATRAATSIDLPHYEAELAARRVHAAA